MNDSSVIVHPAKLEMLPIKEMKSWYDNFVNFSKEILKKDLDYGVIPGVQKPSLLKPGAEKLRFVYGLTVEVAKTGEKIDYDREPMIVDYTYKATVKTKQGQILAECEGNANSFEAKFGFIWVREEHLPEGIDKKYLKTKGGLHTETEYQFSLNKKETTGQYGKPKEHWDKWEQLVSSGKAKKVMKKSRSGKDLVAYEYTENKLMYRIPNPDVMGLKNTIMKMAQKRAFVGAVLIATGASEFFTQDVEDMETFGVEEGVVIDAPKQTETKTAKKDVKEAEQVKEDIKEKPKTETSEPVSNSNDPVRTALINLITNLESNGKVKLDKKIEQYTTEELQVIRDNYRKSIGK